MFFILVHLNDMNYYLAQVNIAKVLAPLEDPLMADFVNNLDRINALAEKNEGFIWRLKDEGNDATSIKVFDDNSLIINMSVWRDAESLFQFTYQSGHVEIFKRRKEWFLKMAEMHMALWYVPIDKMPTVADAEEGLKHIRENGPTEFAFTFQKKFPPPLS